MMKKSIILDILMPTYCYKLGLNRNLNFLCECKNKNKINVIISDNSPESLLSQKEVKEFMHLFDNNFEYIHKEKSKSAIDNWNFLIKNSNAKYFLLLHQDEHFISTEELDKFVDLISKKELQKTIFITKHNSYKNLLGININTLMPHQLTNIILRIYPKILFYVNLIGPPSCLFIPSNNIRYKSTLKMLVDVEYYYRIFKKFNIKFCDVSTYTSISGRSITDSLYKDMSKIIYSERKYLKKTKILNNLDFIKLNLISHLVRGLKYFSIIIKLIFKKVKIGKKLKKIEK